MVLTAITGTWLYNRYHIEKIMTLKVREFTASEYPDNPATLSSRYGNYSHSKLVLENKGGSHFTLTFLPGSSSSSTLVFKNIVVSLMPPRLSHG